MWSEGGTLNVAPSPRTLGERLSLGVVASLNPLDQLRRQLYRVGGRPLAALLGDPQRRTFWLASLLLSSSLLATLLWPLGLLALGPVLWGIPHVLGDVRYLVLKPRLHTNKPRTVLVGLALLASVLGGGIIAGVVAMLVGIALSSAPLRARLGLLLPTLGLLALAVWLRRPAELVFAHLHNVVALGWLLASFRVARYRFWLGAGYAAALLVLMLVPLGPIPLFPGGFVQMDWGYHLAALTPLGDSTWWLRLVLVFAFAQAFHYAIWMRLSPELERRKRAPRSFRATFSALRADFGTWPLLAALVAMVVLAVWALFDLRSAREGYLRVVLFHGYLELTFLGIAWLERRAAARSSTAPLELTA